MEERADGGEARVATANGVAPRALEVVEKAEDERGVEVGEGERGRGFAPRGLDEPQEKTEGVAVARDGARAGVALGPQALDEELLQHGSEARCRGDGRRHGWPPSPRWTKCSNRAAVGRSKPGVAVRYQ